MFIVQNLENAKKKVQRENKKYTDFQSIQR